MKQVSILGLEQDGHNFGRASNPNDVMKAQGFLHGRIDTLLYDCIVAHKYSQVAGFSYALGEGNAFSITISKPGTVYSNNGKSFELLSDVTLDIEAADEDLPRIDVVIAKLEENVDAELELIPFVRLRTSDDFVNSVPMYAPQNIAAPTELHNRAVIQIKTGTPAAVPTVPTLNSNELPLYLINVPAGALQLHDTDIGDMRYLITTLNDAWNLTQDNNLLLNLLTKRVEAVEHLASQPVDLSQVFGGIRSLGDILTLLKNQVDALRDIPEIKYDNPKVTLTDPDSSKIRASGGVDNVPVVDIEIGGVVDFGDKQVIISPYNFDDPDLNARFEQTAGGSANVRVSTDLTLNSVTQIASDGFTDFELREAVFDTFRPAGLRRLQRPVRARLRRSRIQ